jgi:hypothetical protein
MASHTGQVGTFDVLRATTPSPILLPVAFNKAPQTNYGQEDVIFPLTPSSYAQGSTVVDAGSLPGPALAAQGDAQLQEGWSATADWFERFHIVPRSFDFGNILSTQQTDVEVYSAFRYSVHTWNDYINNAGAGVTLQGQPVLPYSFLPQTGVQMTLLVDTIGEPFVDTTLDFVFDTGTMYIPLEVQRVTLFNLPPEMPYTEVLEFATDVIEHSDGSEQRISIRKNPRQLFDWQIIMEPGIERQIVDSVMFNWQSRIYGIPIWHELTTLTTAATIGTLTITVGTTNYADYRIGGLVLIRSSQTDYDVLVLVSKTATTLTFENPTLKAHAVGAQVMPLRTAVVQGQPRGRRYTSDAEALSLRFRVRDNDVSIASTAAFSTFNGKVLLDDLNGIDSALEETFDQDVTVIDFDTGITEESSDWDAHRRVTPKTFLAKGRQRVWETRQLMHSLRGRQVSFYLPTFGKDLELVVNTVIGSPVLNIRNCGYTQYVQSRQPKNVLRIKLVDGTVILRTVLSSVITSETQEALTLNANWASIITPAQIDRIMYVEKVRFDSDQITFQHTVGDRTVKIKAPVKTVFE